jgi:hypothetical protein
MWEIQSSSRETYFKMLKKIENKILYVYLDVLCLHTSFQKNEHFVCLVYKDKL